MYGLLLSAAGGLTLLLQDMQPTISALQLHACHMLHNMLGAMMKPPFTMSVYSVCCSQTDALSPLPTCCAAISAEQVAWTQGTSHHADLLVLYIAKVTSLAHAVDPQQLPAWPCWDAH